MEAKFISNRQWRAERVRKLNRGHLYHGWTLDEMSNNQVLKLANYNLVRKDKR